ncbi:MAG TPA: DUF1801 domain-containing protein [Longimicrobiaceae bacterium]|nr:DUF1801 domain-containing protein [Longimicrobiaceae bacterium]
MPKLPSVTPEDVLASFPADVGALAEEMRAFIRGAVPGVEERAYPVWRGIGYHDAQCGYFCGLFPDREEVRLGFEHGASLPDPEGLLTGSGKRVRYVVLRPGHAAPRDAIRELLDAALLHGAVR